MTRGLECDSELPIKGEVTPNGRSRIHILLYPVSHLGTTGCRLSTMIIEHRLLTREKKIQRIDLDIKQIITQATGSSTSHHHRADLSKVSPCRDNMHESE